MFRIFLILMIVSFLSEKAAAKSIIHEVVDELATAKACLPNITSTKITFCSGPDLLISDFIKLKKGGFESCIKSIEQQGYSVYIEGSTNKVDETLLHSFLASTKNAESLHDEKTVFFRKESHFNSCLHEYLHVLQWQKSNTKLFAPLKRKTKIEEVKKYLNQKVAKLEKASKASRLTLQKEIQQEINLVQDYIDSPRWLDEKDVYFFFYHFCESDLNCSNEESDKIISYLFTIKDYFPWKLSEFIMTKSVQLVRAKEEEQIKKMDYKLLPSSIVTKTIELLTKSWDELIDYAKNKGVSVVKFELGKDKVTALDMSIALETWNKLPEPSKNMLIMLFTYSKIGDGFILGKYVCGIENAKAIIVTQKTSKLTFIHELLHFEQSELNPKICNAISDQATIENDFKQGRISRNEYESLILSYKVLLWKIEEEVYFNLLSVKDQSEFELNNNKIQYLKYKTKGTLFSEEKSSESLVSGSEFSFSEKDDLPFVTVSNVPLILDLGAMNSVISPMLIFKEVSVDKFQPLATLNLTNVNNEVVEAPYVRVNQPILVGELSVEGFKSIIANLKFKGIDGVLGLDFFHHKNFEIYPKDKRVKFMTELKRPKTAFTLQKTFEGKYKALEFICPNGEILRLDTGSQVVMDVAEKLGNKTIKCGNLSFYLPKKSKLEEAVIFAHDVSVNLGWPWIRQWKKITVSLNDGWINFE